MSKRPEKLKGPEVGQDVYVPTSLYLSHGADDFIGGLCEVIEVKDGISAGKSVPFIRVKERPSTSYNWKRLLEKQESLQAEYGTRRGYPDPDLDPEFNRWD